MGFSYIGATYLCLLLVPNLLWARHQPAGYTSENEAKIFVLLERAGEISVSITAVLSVSCNPEAGKQTWLLVASLLCMLLYECYWIRYFRRPCLQTFYNPLLHIPLPGALLPILAFFLLGCYGQAWLMLLATCILAIGHLQIHNQHRKELSSAG